uniref:Uncharacterized protein n=1 Tax=Peronospora matthiolae TaxID=2874970 RepID=A0AAV1V1J8_9STRA
MEAVTLLLAALLAVVVVRAQDARRGTVGFQPGVVMSRPTLDAGPTQISSLVLWAPKWVGHDTLQPFPQPKPVTRLDVVAIKLKPKLFIVHGCHPYPAVNATGHTSNGLKTSGYADGHCKGSGHGSQVYGRATRFRSKWAIMYAWYFPKDAPDEESGQRHDWEHAIVWINNPKVKRPEIQAVSVSCGKKFGYLKKVAPGPEVFDGTRLKMSYGADHKHDHRLGLTAEKGEDQDLIMWEQLTDEARCAFDTILWTNVMMPLNDAWYKHELKRAWPFER